MNCCPHAVLQRLGRARAGLALTALMAASVGLTLGAGDKVTAAGAVVVTIDASTVQSVSRFRTGTTLTQDTFDSGEPTAVAAGRQLLWQ